MIGWTTLPQEGYLELRPDRPGLGVEINEEAIEGNELRALGALESDAA